MPFGHAFASATWLDEGWITSMPGEQSIGQWVNGSRPVNGGDGNELAVACAEENRAMWEDGIPPDIETGPYDGAGLPLCCTEGITCCPCDIPDTFSGEVTATLLCDCATGVSLTFTRVSGTVCRWESQTIICDGHELILAMEFTPEDNCGAQGIVMCDGVEFGRESAGGDLCDLLEGGTIIVPLFNDCCQFIQWDWSW